jgi:hypothetical protein
MTSIFNSDSATVALQGCTKVRVTYNIMYMCSVSEHLLHGVDRSGKHAQPGIRILEQHDARNLKNDRFKVSS